MRTLACLVLACVAGSAFGQDEPKLPEYKLTLRAVGPPLPSFRYELVPARDLIHVNAALLEHRALHLLADARPAGKEFFDKQQKLDDARDKPLKDFPKEEAREYLKPFHNVFKEMEAAAKCDFCEWGTEQRIAAEGIGFLLPDAQKMRELAFLLTLRCRLHAADGKSELALRDVQTGFALARHAAQGPTLINFLIGNAIVALFVRELEVVMQLPDCPNLYWSLTAMPRPLVNIRKGIEGELRSMETTIPLPKDVEKGPMTPEEALAALDRLWAGIQRLADEPTTDRKPGIAESRMGLAFYITMQHPSARKSLLAAGKTEAELDAMPPAQVVMLDALVRFRNLRDQHFVWFNAPYAEAMQGMRMSEARIKEIRKSPADYLQMMLLLLLPAVDKVYGAEVRTERRIASLRAVEAVRLHSAKGNGMPPAKLSDVTDVPVPTDPTTGQPFGYTVEGNTFTISVAPPPGEPANQSNSWKYVVTLAK
ncbi:MAG TPA: hypothetical protein VHR66_11180 [Gemmataceae bacterium]|jgi:hypothetical protein|nr:hypothetical protein [Gemmataceae bacterium]